MALRVARGLFRLWVVGTALFVLAVALVSYSDIKAEFDRPKPNQIFIVTAPDGRTFELKAPDMQTARAMAARLAKDYVPDKPLLSDYDVLTPEPNPWVSVARAAGMALGIPLVVLILGASLVWAFSGFSAKQPIGTTAKAPETAKAELVVATDATITTITTTMAGHRDNTASAPSEPAVP